MNTAKAVCTLLLIALTGVSSSATATLINTLDEDATVILTPVNGGYQVDPASVPAFQTESIEVREGYYDITVYLSESDPYDQDQLLWIGDELDGGFTYVID
ncbi:hypothetical protein JW921_00320 [Candidatus Fermentibacterales bacterium]|nr:hypothetical protein [Candidatus Fermentibacterales bacterium]